MIAIAAFCPLEILPEKRKFLEREQFRFIIETLKGQIDIPFYIKTGIERISVQDISFLKGLKVIEELGKGEVSFAGTSSIPGTLIDIETGKPLIPYASIYGRHRRPIECYKWWFHEILIGTHKTNLDTSINSMAGTIFQT